MVDQSPAAPVDGPRHLADDWVVYGKFVVKILTHYFQNPLAASVFYPQHEFPRELAHDFSF